MPGTISQEADANSLVTNRSKREGAGVRIIIRDVEQDGHYASTIALHIGLITKFMLLVLRLVLQFKHAKSKLHLVSAR